MDILIRYKVAPEHVDAQVAAIRKFKDALRLENDPDQIYDMYREAEEDDGVAFVHLAWMATKEDLDRFQSTAHFKEFADGLKARAVAPPEVTHLYAVAVDHVGLLGR